MAEINKQKKRQSTNNKARYAAQKFITARNKARKAAKWAKIWKKRRDPARVERLEIARLNRRAQRKADRLAKVKDFRTKKPSANENQKEAQEIVVGT